MDYEYDLVQDLETKFEKNLEPSLKYKIINSTHIKKILNKIKFT